MGKRRAMAAFVVVGLLAAGCGDDGSDDGSDDDEAGADQPEDGPIVLDVLSSRPEYVSGGDALVSVRLNDDDLDPGDVVVGAGGEDVSEGFAPHPDDDRQLLGMVDGLDEGDTELTAQVGDHEADLVLTNYPTSGPMFAGDHLELAECSTENYGLDPSTPDEYCDAPTVVTWEYVDEAGERHDLDDPANPPGDVEMVELDGAEVPFVIRTETGVLNRSVYQITLLEPSADPADPLVPDTSAWNDRLVYRFGGGCGATFTQGYIGTGPVPLELLREGYATATATFNTFQVMCNDQLSAETASMVKEHFVEAYGVPAHTLGSGGSGGAIQQLLLAQNNPGLLDGIAPAMPYPDALSISPGVFDCALLTNYYGSAAGGGLDADQQRAINGHAVADTCGMWTATFATGIDPAAGCQFNVAEAFGAESPSVTPDDVYDADTNPDGLRCSVWESNAAVAGIDPDTGYARSGYDNQGVQYGLAALNDGDISVDEFLDLNEQLGGFDNDGQPQPERSEVDVDLFEQVYASGRVSGAQGGLPEVPVIMINPYTDDLGDIHDRVRAFSVADRLADDDGTWPETLSLWSIGPSSDGDGAGALTGAVDSYATEAVFALDEWLTAAGEHQDSEGGDWVEALAVSKPDSAQSRCLLEGNDPIVGPDANEDSGCVDALPIHEEPRMVAGAPRSGDVIKCALVPVDEATDLYEVELTDDDLERLEAAFPDGVCDYTQPGVGQVAVEDTWQALDTADA